VRLRVLCVSVVTATTVFSVASVTVFSAASASPHSKRKEPLTGLPRGPAAQAAAYFFQNTRTVYLG
jgi:hypothetical protein